MDPAPLRDCLADIMRRLRRNKVLGPRHGLMLAAINGHETHSSYKRRHEGSLERGITVDGRKVVQYSNRFTVFQLIGEGFNEPVTYWHSRHVFHHHAHSLLALWLVMFIAHAVFHCFLRNLRPVLREAHTVIHFAAPISAELLEGRRLPCRPPLRAPPAAPARLRPRPVSPRESATGHWIGFFTEFTRVRRTSGSPFRNRWWGATRLDGYPESGQNAMR